MSEQEKNIDKASNLNDCAYETDTNNVQQSRIETEKIRIYLNKKKQPTLIWFLGLMGKRLPIYMAAIFISTVGLAGSHVANSYLVKTVVTAAQNKNANGVLLSLFLNFLVIVGTMMIWRTGIVRYNIEAKRGIAKVEKLVFGKAMRLPMSYYEKYHSGDFMSKLIFDTERAGDIYGSRLRRLLAAMISAVVYLIPMFYFSWQLTLCLLAISLVSFGVNSIFVNPMKKNGSILSKQNGMITEQLTNLIAGIDVTKIFPVGKVIIHDFEQTNDQFCRTQKKTNHLSAGLESLNCLFDLTGSLAFLGLGIYFVSVGLVSLGNLTAIYVIYGSFRNVFLEIGKYLPQMMNCVANAQKVRDFLELEEEPGMLLEKELNQVKSIQNESTNLFKNRRDNNILDNILQNFDNKAMNTISDANVRILINKSNSNFDGSEDSSQGNYLNEHLLESKIDNEIVVEVENISFAYEDSRTILNNFSMKVKKGSFIALTGVSGRGKSTIAKLLLGFYPPKSGNLYINGINYTDLTMHEVREQIGYVPQEPYLYEVSIAENIAYGRSMTNPEDVPMEEIIAAAKAANAHEFIMKLENGYDTQVGERGNRLSGGEKQRIAIARAVLKNAPILLLDEATSALDNESERLVNEALNRMCKDRTTIMIAHRASTIAMADTVIAM